MPCKRSGLVHSLSELLGEPSAVRSGSADYSAGCQSCDPFQRTCIAPPLSPAVQTRAHSVSPSETLTGPETSTVRSVVVISVSSRPSQCALSSCVRRTCPHDRGVVEVSRTHPLARTTDPNATRAIPASEYFNAGLPLWGLRGLPYPELSSRMNLKKGHGKAVRSRPAV